ncbi:MAG TPA: hypothetical protein VK879_01910 [Candidatus Sulfomarinibacteraceae bacterium]|nr:hypothetical protein [Candidatus Sulfomarinibacteraceae bacterium]
MGFRSKRRFGVLLGKGSGIFLLVMLLFAGLVGAVLAQRAVITDEDLENTATNDGEVFPAEYSGHTVGINGSAGDVIGQNSKIYVDAGGDEDALHFGFVPAGSGIIGYVIIYIDSVDGGFNSTVPLTADGSNLHEHGIAATGGSDLYFAPNFYADYAVSLTSQAGHLYELADDNSLNNLKSVNLQEGQSDHEGEYEIDFLMSDIGLTEGGAFKYVVTLVYPQTNLVYRYNEFQGVSLDTFNYDGNWKGDTTTTESFNLMDDDYNLFSAGGPTHVGSLAARARSVESGVVVLLWPLLLALLTVPFLLRRRW